MRTPRNIFVINLVISDLLLCSFTIPFTLVDSLTPFWELGPEMVMMIVLLMTMVLMIMVLMTMGLMIMMLRIMKLMMRMMQGLIDCRALLATQIFIFCTNTNFATTNITLKHFGTNDFEIKNCNAC